MTEVQHLTQVEGVYMQKIDCILLSLLEQKYLLPAVAITELIMLHEYNPNALGPLCIGTLNWRNTQVLLFLPHEISTEIKALPHPKVAIMNALTQNSQPGHFGLFFAGKAQKISLKEEEIKWLDRNKRQVQIMKADHPSQEAILPDLQSLWDKVKFITHS